MKEGRKERDEREEKRERKERMKIEERKVFIEDKKHINQVHNYSKKKGRGCSYERKNRDWRKEGWTKGG